MNESKKKKTDNRIMVRINVPSDLDLFLDEVAGKFGISKSGLIVLILSFYVKITHLKYIGRKTFQTELSGTR